MHVSPDGHTKTRWPNVTTRQLPRKKNTTAACIYCFDFFFFLLLRIINLSHKVTKRIPKVILYRSEGKQELFATVPDLQTSGHCQTHVTLKLLEEPTELARISA